MFYVDEFLESLRDQRYSQKTIGAYRSLINHLKEYLEKHGVAEIKSASEQQIQEYAGRLEDKNPACKHAYVQILRMKRYFAFLEQRGFLFLSPLREYPSPKFLPRSYPRIAAAEIKAVLAAIKPQSPFLIRAKAILELAYSSALRPREIYSLKITDIDFTRGVLFIRMSKGRKDRLVPVGKEALYWIGEYIEKVRPRYIKNNKHGCVFISHKSGKPLTVWGLRSAIRTALKRSGLELFPTYSLRAASATALLTGGMNAAYIGKLLGHAELRTTQIYLRINQTELRDEITRKHPRNRFPETKGEKR